jgi:hypothetical protein
MSPPELNEVRGELAHTLSASGCAVYRFRPGAIAASGELADPILVFCPSGELADPILVISQLVAASRLVLFQCLCLRLGKQVDAWQLCQKVNKVLCFGATSSIHTVCELFSLQDHNLVGLSSLSLTSPDIVTVVLSFSLFNNTSLNLPPFLGGGWVLQ